MAAGRKDSLAEMDVLSAEMERLFYRLFHPKLSFRPLRGACWHPLTDICETEDAFVVRMELAGVKKEDVNVELEGERLYISGIRREQPVGSIKAHHQMEINYGPFERIILLRAAVSRDAILASFENGFLTITIPKAVPSERVTRIQIARERE